MLTFDTIRDLERTERTAKKLQKMPDDIVAELRDYLNRKEKITEKTSADITEMENIKSTIKRLFEARESKILSSVLDTVRTGLPPENMTKEEEGVFYRMVDMLKQYREGFFVQLREKKEEKTVYRVRTTMPAFVGPDMKTYSLTEGNTVELPVALAELLIKEGVIELVKE